MTFFDNANHGNLKELFPVKFVRVVISNTFPISWDAAHGGS